MCGRVVQARPLDVLAELFDAEPTPLLAGSYKPAWNIPPTQPVVGLTPATLDLYSWGLRGRFFNARAETVTSNGTFSPALRERRLAVLVDGFYEWHGTPRRPLFFSRADGQPMALAGLWDPWTGLRGPNAVDADGGIEAACTIITTDAGPDLAGIHDRQPVLLDGDGLARWLAPGPLGAAVLAELLAPGAAGVLRRHPVDPRVGDVRNDAPELVEPYAEPEPLTLFG